MKKKILLGLLAVLVIIQFFRPEKNQSDGLSQADISFTYAVPADVHQTFMKKCYDCHSNNTEYPWYNNIQPVAWWMASHVNEGKEHLDFSEFKNYDERKAKHKLEETAEMIAEDEMPLPSYLWIHRDAKLTNEEKDAIYAWIASLGVDVKKEGESHEH
jgi:hypothetical protein